MPRGYRLDEVTRWAKPREEQKRLFSSQTAEHRQLIASLLISKVIHHLPRIAETDACACCGKQDSVCRHHIITRGLGYKFGLVRGQLHHPNNIMLLCRSCHSVLHQLYRVKFGLGERESYY
ncbi:hypothetical protein LCGC14_0847040 [marine sediment metagenome]|uniref:HNH domain-containing protein n=1 Tax=marine sediment metagenome TaxID=412755 RepID=A0A0F9PG59_9ZZZZ